MEIHGIVPSLRILTSPAMLVMAITAAMLGNVLGGLMTIYFVPAVQHP